MQRFASGQPELELQDVERAFDRWRRSRQGYGRIPNELWRKAAHVAAAHGIDATAACLQLDRKRLRKWVRDVRATTVAPGPQFVELPLLPSAPTAECTLELEDVSGRKLKISLKGAATEQALQLSQLLWSCEP